MEVNLIDLIDEIANDKNFNIDFWCERDAIVLERLAGLIRRELEKKKCNHSYQDMPVCVHCGHMSE